MGAKEPVLEASLLHKLGHPPTGCDQLGDDLGHPDEPARHDAVDERGVGAPAERIAMDDLGLGKDPAATIGLFDNQRESRSALPLQHGC